MSVVALEMLMVSKPVGYLFCLYWIFRLSLEHIYFQPCLYKILGYILGVKSLILSLPLSVDFHDFAYIWPSQGLFQQGAAFLLTPATGRLPMILFRLHYFVG